MKWNEMPLFLAREAYVEVVLKKKVNWIVVKANLYI